MVVGSSRVRFVAVLVAAATVASPAAAQSVLPRDFPSLETQRESPEDIPADRSPTWRGALEDSLRLLAIEHSIRIGFQDKTRRELGGPFWKDYHRSVRTPQTWGDGDSAFVNYIGHPIHGAASGYIWLDHEDGAHDPELGFSRAYWASRSRATAWAAGYSLQFEFGPLSEASIGNVGLNPETTAGSITSSRRPARSASWSRKTPSIATSSGRSSGGRRTACCARRPACCSIPAGRCRTPRRDGRRGHGPPARSADRRQRREHTQRQPHFTPSCTTRPSSALVIAPNVGVPMLRPGLPSRS